MLLLTDVFPLLDHIAVHVDENRAFGFDFRAEQGVAGPAFLGFEDGRAVREHGGERETGDRRHGQPYGPDRASAQKFSSLHHVFLLVVCWRRCGQWMRPERTMRSKP
jgi:hypothetical protein